MCCFSLSAQMKDNLPMIKANSEVIDIKDGEEWSRGNWYVAPEYKPDVYGTVVKRKKKITFYSDLDSISFVIKPNRNYDFVILRDKDTCWTRIEAKKDIPPVKFTKKFKKKNKGKYVFEVPEVQELVHIIMALTPIGLKDFNLVDHNGEYYEEVISYFSPFKEEPIVALINSQMEGNYARVKMDACGFYFKGDLIKKDKQYDRMNWGLNNFIDPMIPELEAFAKKTNFQKFYSEHTEYYNGLIAKMDKQTPIKKQWDWLEDRFPNRYDHYRITFSPMVNGSHSTNRYNDKGFKQTAMFICGPIEGSSHNEKVVEGLMTRVVFSEIDHNYVNPVSDLYLEEINKAFADRDDWTTKGSSADSYGNSYSVFNEYMTWAVFSLYALDNFNEEDFKIINDRVELQMNKWRGFKKFSQFNQEMISLYKKYEDKKTIADLYPEMLEWCKKN